VAELGFDAVSGGSDGSGVGKADRKIADIAALSPEPCGRCFPERFVTCAEQDYAA
jgi:hypothetical protein